MGSLKSESSPSSSDSQTEPKNERCRTRKTTLAASDGIAEQKNISTLSSMSSSAPRWKTSRCELLQDQTKGEPYTLKNVSTVRGIATRSRIHSRWAWKQDSTRCAAIGTLPRHATGVIVLCEALGTM